jgi:hypothetical protein
VDNGSIIFFFAAILIVAGLLFAMISLTKKGAAHLDVDKYRSKWLAIEQSLVRDQPASAHLAILNADKLVDQALRERGVRGETMGERMKTAKATWSNRNSIWEAHKLRNQIAHETDASVSYDQARRALAGFKQALKDLGAI